MSEEEFLEAVKDLAVAFVEWKINEEEYRSKYDELVKLKQES